MTLARRTAFAALVALAALTSPPTSGAIAADDPVEDVEDVEVAAVAEAPCDEPNTLVATFGKLHPAMVHLPIAWVFLVLLLDALTFGLGRAEYARFGLFTLGAAVVSAVPAMVSGLLRAEVLEAQPPLAPLVEAHETLMFVMAAVLLAAFVLRLVMRHRLTGLARAVYLGLLVVTAALVGYGGHLGGRIVFGPDHLPF